MLHRTYGPGNWEPGNWFPVLLVQYLQAEESPASRGVEDRSVTLHPPRATIPAPRHPACALLLALTVRCGQHMHMTQNAVPKIHKLIRVSQTFTPSAPISRRDLFAGRGDQILRVATALVSPGRQVALYGERGVGKTSLANVIEELMAPEGGAPIPAYRINCDTDDVFFTIWKRAFEEARLTLPEEWTRHSPPRPDDIRRALGNRPPFYLILDEFDRVADDDTLSLMADTMKAFSDHAIGTKIMVVGVASSIDQLVGEHESIQRAIQEVLMPRMTEQDMRDIVQVGAKAIGIDFAPGAEEAIVKLAEGLPHFVHLLAGGAAEACIQDDRVTVSVRDVRKAAETAVQSHSLMREYQTAIQSGRKNLFAEVLTACALAPKNDLGQFTAKAVETPLTEIMGKTYDIPGFAKHLNRFTGEDRGRVLIQEGVERRFTYRFRNPLLQPFAILMAIKHGILPPGYMKEFIEDSNEPAPELPMDY